MTASQWIALLNVVALAAIMFAMGLQVRFDAILASTRSPTLVTKCMLANYFGVPLAAGLLLYLFHCDILVAIGIFILAICPGAPVGPPLTALARGNLSISIGMMVVLAFLSIALSPILLILFLKLVATDRDTQINVLGIARTLLIAQILPLLVGLAVHQWLPRLRDKIVMPVKLLSNVLLLLLVVAILYVQYSTLADIRTRGWIGMSLLLGISLLIGWSAGGGDRRNRVAIAITTGPRNAAVGLAIATGQFAGTAAVTSVVAYGIFSMLGTACVVACWQLMSRGRPTSLGPTRSGDLT